MARNTSIGLSFSTSAGAQFNIAGANDTGFSFSSIFRRSPNMMFTFAAQDATADASPNTSTA